MWVSKEQWDALVARVDYEESLRLEAWRRIDELAEAVRQAKPVAEKEVAALDAYLFGLATPPVTLLQKVNLLLLDHLKLRVQPEGTTPVALVKKTGAK